MKVEFLTYIKDYEQGKVYDLPEDEAKLLIKEKRAIAVKGKE